jgi:hypothetical protein
MALDDHSIITLAEIKAELSITASGRDNVLEECANRATGIVEGHLDRQIVERTGQAALTEYYTLNVYTSELYLRDYPIIAITSVQELLTWPTTYATALVENTSFFLGANAGVLTRIDGTGYASWATGKRSVKVVYRAGYAAYTDVPRPIRDVTRRLAALLYSELDRKQHGISSYSDALGNVSRLYTARLTPDMIAQLGKYRRFHNFGDSITVERD